jgi:anti-sigma-K factor RskA
MNEIENKWDDLMAGYVLGNLSAEETEELQSFLDAQPEQVKELEKLQETLELMAYTLPTKEPSQKLWDAIAESTKESNIESPGIDPEPKSIVKPFWRKMGSQVAVSIAAILVVAVGWSNYTLRQNLVTAKAEIARQKDIVAMLQNPETHLVSLKGMDMASSASGRIIMTPGELQSVLILQKLPVLPQNQYYQLWSIVNGKKVASGQFNADKNGTVLVKLPTPSAQSVTGLVITLEKVTDSKAIPGLMVMSSSL